jgi:hypothetical protein
MKIMDEEIETEPRKTSPDYQTDFSSTSLRRAALLSAESNQKCEYSPCDALLRRRMLYSGMHPCALASQRQSPERGLYEPH